MSKILDFILKAFGNDIPKAFCSLCDAIKSFFSYKTMFIQNESIKNNEKKQKEYTDKIDKITKTGTIEDLLDLRK